MKHLRLFFVTALIVGSSIPRVASSTPIKPVKSWHGNFTTPEKLTPLQELQKLGYGSDVSDEQLKQLGLQWSPFSKIIVRSSPMSKEDELLMEIAPKSGYIANTYSWVKLWTAWRGKKAAPKVNFQNHLVFVGTTSCSKNGLGSTFDVNYKGDLTVRYISNDASCPGFAYLIDVVERSGIMTIGGNAVNN